ncbi:unnamed protein product [Pedinophyceae sp. YPF-701]|nr:unnamed protein product [Pedinophyceae sp. YPF-701]
MGKATMGPRSPSPRRPGTAASAFPASERGTQPSTHGSSRVEEPGAGPASPSSPQRRPTTAQSKLERTKSKSGAVPRGSASFKTTGRGELFPTRAAGAHVGPYDAPVPTLHRTDKGAVKMDHQTTRAYAETQADPGERFRTPRPGSYFDSELWDYRGRDREGGHSPRAMHHQIRAPPTQPQEPSAPERPRTAGGLRDYIQTYRPTTVGGAGIAAGRPVSRGTLSKTVPFLSKTAPFMGSGGMRDPNDVVSKAREWGAERPWTTGGHGGACGRSGFTGPRRQTHLGVRGETRLLGVPEPAVLVVGRELETTVVLSERGVIAQPHVTGELSHHPSRNPLDVAPGHMHLRTAGDAQPWWGSADQPETVVGTPRRTPQGDYVTVWQAVDEDGTAWHDAPASQEPTWMADGAQITATVRMEDRERPTSALSGYNITSPLQNSRPTSPYAKRPQSSRPRGTARTPAMRMREMSVPEDGTTD